MWTTHGFPWKMIYTWWDWIISRASPGQDAASNEKAEKAHACTDAHARLSVVSKLQGITP